MSEQVPASPGADGSTPVPRDPPDQQADGGADPWEPQENTGGDGAGSDDVPDTDEAGTGRRGTAGAAPEADSPSPAPAPEEPSG
ncbi:hypothetical protein ABZ953_36980 [Streptomyces sp. NPDC046465]|uniref:hypothetical protein n=1 Tax=Streptomyces sp. NPDC046465 TaxID=3155810 RepID=UPI0033FC8563